MSIPARLTQFWDKPVLPDDIAPLVETWRSQSALTCVLSDEEAARAFIAEAFGPDLVRDFDACALPAMKSDLFRVCSVYHHGGWYADCSIECLKPPLDMISDGVAFVYYRRWHGGVNNGLFAATPHHPVLMSFIDRISDNIRNRRGDSAFTVTGPAVWNARFPKEHVEPGVQELGHADIANIMVRFHQDLAHKKDGQHWSDKQTQAEVFND